MNTIKTALSENRFAALRAVGLVCALLGADSGQPPTPAGTDPRPPSRDSTETPLAPPSGSAVGAFPIDLPTALRLANASNPTIALARERVVEANARLQQAEVLWLPNLQTGPAYQRHDGRNQNSRGDVFQVSKSSLFEGGGAALRFDSADALFEPLIARQLTQAAAAAARAVTDDIQLEVASAYQDLLQAYARLAINAETLANAELMLKGAEAAEAAKAGKTPADAPRARTEVSLRQAERIDLEGQLAVASARLAQLLLLQPTVDLYPADAAVVPVTLVPTEGPLDDLVAGGLLNHPELAESRALVEATLARWRQARVSPLLPRLEVAYFAGYFGGGKDDHLSDFGGRGDGTAQALWELRNLGVGDLARARERRAQYNEANFHVAEVQARIAAEVTVSAKLARTRLRTLNHAQEAVRQAAETWRRLKEASFGLAGADRRYDPLEPLLAEQALTLARNQYLTEVIEYNKAQFRLYTAMGRPAAEALPSAIAIPVSIPAVPNQSMSIEPQKSSQK